MNKQELKKEIVDKAVILRPAFLKEAIWTLAKSKYYAELVKLFNHIGTKNILQMYEDSGWGDKRVSDVFSKDSVDVAELGTVSSYGMEELILTVFRHNADKINVTNEWCEKNVPYIYEHSLYNYVNSSANLLTKTIRTNFTKSLVEKILNLNFTRDVYEPLLQRGFNERLLRLLASYVNMLSRGERAIFEPSSLGVENLDYYLEHLVVLNEATELINKVPNPDWEDFLEDGWDAVQFLKKHGDLHIVSGSLYNNIGFYHDNFGTWKSSVTEDIRSVTALKTLIERVQKFQVRMEQIQLSEIMVWFAENYDKIPSGIVWEYDNTGYLSSSKSLKSKRSVEDRLKLMLVTENINKESLESQLLSIKKSYERFQYVIDSPKFKTITNFFEKLNDVRLNADLSNLGNHGEHETIRRIKKSEDKYSLFHYVSDVGIDIVLDILNKVRFKRIRISPEAPRSAPLEKFAFGDQRKGIKEPNTPIEEQLYNALKAHITNNVHMQPKYVELIKSLMSKDYYKTMFRTPKAKYAYRGMGGLPESFLNSKAYASHVPKSAQGEARIQAVFSSNQGKGYASSWTSSPHVAFTKFGSKCVLVAKVHEDDNHFMTGDFYETKSSIGDYRDEKEFIALGDVNCFYIFWSDAYRGWNSDKFSDFGKSILRQTKDYEKLISSFAKGFQTSSQDFDEDDTDEYDKDY